MSLESKLFVIMICLGGIAFVAMFIAIATAFDTPGSRANEFAMSGAGIFIIAGLFGLTSAFLGIRSYVKRRTFHWWLPMDVIATVVVLWFGWSIVQRYVESWEYLKM